MDAEYIEISRATNDLPVSEDVTDDGNGTKDSTQENRASNGDGENDDIKNEDKKSKRDIKIPVLDEDENDEEDLVEEEREEVGIPILDDENGEENDMDTEGVDDIEDSDSEDAKGSTALRDNGASRGGLNENSFDCVQAIK